MPCVRFEPTIPASERTKTVHDLHRATTVIGFPNHVYRLKLHIQYLFPCILHDRSILSCLTFMSITMLSGVQIINLLFLHISLPTYYFFFLLHHFDTFRFLICFVLFQGNIQNVAYTRSFTTQNWSCNHYRFISQWTICFFSDKFEKHPKFL
jgi:hypothetical protein